MNLVWHIVKKDVRRLWVPILLWSVLLIAKVGLNFAVFSPFASDGAWFERMQMGYGVLAGIETVICFLLAASLVLEDPLVGSTMFWATRPIDGRRLLAAKIVGALGLFFLVPLAVAMPWWLACGFGPEEIGASSVVLLSIQTLTVAPALVLASVVDRSSRFLQALLVVLVAFVVLTMSKLVTPQIDLSVPITLRATRFWLFSFVMFAVGVGAVWMQFTTRRNLRTVVCLAVGLGLAWWVNAAWPWDIVRSWTGDRPSREFDEAAELRASLLRVRIEDARYRSAGLKTVKFDFALEGLPESAAMKFARAAVVLRWAPGDELRDEARVVLPEPKRVQHAVLDMPLPTWEDDAETRDHLLMLRKSLKSARGLRGVQVGPLPVAEKKTVASAEMIVSAEIARRIEEAPPAFEITLHLSFSRPQVLAEFPLVPGRTWVGQGIRMHVVADQTQQGGLESKELVIVAARPLLDVVPAFGLLQRKTGYISDLARPTGGGSIASFRSGFSRTRVHFNLPRVWRTDGWAPIPGSDSPYSVVAVVFRFAGSIQRELHGETLPLVPAPAK